MTCLCWLLDVILVGLVLLEFAGDNNLVWGFGGILSWVGCLCFAFCLLVCLLWTFVWFCVADDLVCCLDGRLFLTLGIDCVCLCYYFSCVVWVFGF